MNGRISEAVWLGFLSIILSVLIVFLEQLFIDMGQLKNPVLIDGIHIEYLFLGSGIVLVAVGLYLTYLEIQAKKEKPRRLK